MNNDAYGISIISRECRKCQFVETCDHKQMEGMAYLNEAVKNAGSLASAPVLRETVAISINGRLQTVYKDDIRREIARSLKIPGYLEFGA